MIKTLIAAMDDEIARNGENAHVLMERGRLKFSIGDHTGAMQDLKRAAQLDPTLVEGISGEFTGKK